MNLVHCRESLTEMYEHQVWTKHQYEQLRVAPIFVYDLVGDKSFTEEELEYCKQHIFESETSYLPRVLPFQFFGLVVRIPEATGKTLEAVYWVDGTLYKDRQDRVDVIVPLTVVRQEVFKPEKVESWVKAEYTKARQGDPRPLVLFTFWRDKKPMDVSDDAKDTYKGMFTKLSISSRSIVTRFTYDVMSGTSFTVRVEPPKSTAHRSVQWRHARTHYLVLNRKHAEQCRDQRRGPTEGELTRGAHWRRAHFRRLVSERYVHKKGQIISIKQMWVGPKEWEGQDGKVYVVVS